MSRFRQCVLLCLIAGWWSASRAVGQALPTATMPFALGVSAGGGVRSAGVGGAVNVDARVGAAVELRPVGAWMPSVIGVVSRPVLRGSVAGEREVLGGVRVSRPLVRMGAAPRLVFGELLAGEGEIRYLGKGMAAAQPPYFYTLSHSVVWAAGGGVEQAVRARRAVRLSVQVQRWQTPVTTSGVTYAATLGVEMVWRPGWGGVR